MKLAKLDKTVVLGALAIMLAALLWSLDGVFIRPKFYILPPGLVVFLEHFLGLIVLSPFIFLNWKKIKTLSKKTWGAVIWVSVFGGLLGTLMITKAFFAAVHGETTFATVVVLQKLQPFFALFLARLILKEKLNKQFYLWAGVAILAAYFLAFGKTGLSITSIDWLHHAAVFALLAAFSFGSSTVFGKRIINSLDYRAAAGLRFAFTTVLSLIYILITTDLFKMGNVTGNQWGLLAVIVFTSGALAMFIYYFGLRRVTASQATICELFWPLSAVILDYILHKNTLSVIQIIAAIVLLVAFFQVVKRGQPKTIIFTSHVAPGKGWSEKLGFYPTANLNLDKIDPELSHGVYHVDILMTQGEYQGILHYGFKDTFSEGLSAEVLIKDFNNNIYGEELQITVKDRIRDVKRFKNIDELKHQIKKDLKNIP